jgi:hypothetical protein
MKKRVTISEARKLARLVQDDADRLRATYAQEEANRDASMFDRTITSKAIATEEYRRTFLHEGERREFHDPETGGSVVCYVKQDGTILIDEIRTL